MAEWSKAPVLKTGKGATPSWVRIPLHPPPFFILKTTQHIIFKPKRITVKFLFTMLFVLLQLSNITVLRAHSDIKNTRHRVANAIEIILDEEELAETYYFGDGDEKDFNKAYEFATIAYKKGSKYAAYLLGLIHYHGNGVQKNYTKAKAFFEESNLAVPKSLYMLGYMYEKGLGVQQNYLTAVKYYEQAANKQIMWAAHNLGILYLYGNGVTKDIKKALSLLNKAAKGGLDDAYYSLGVIYYEGKDVAADYKKAYSFFTKAQNKGQIEAYTYLGVIYENGLGVKQDVAKARELYLKGAEHNDAYACFNLGRLYIKGVGGEEDVEAGLKWIEKAASLKYEPAKEFLYTAYNDRTLVAPNVYKALKYADYDIRVFFANLHALYYILFKIVVNLMLLAITIVLMRYPFKLAKVENAPKGLGGWLLYWLLACGYVYMFTFYKAVQVINDADCINGIILAVLYVAMLIRFVLACWGIIKKKIWFPKVVIASLLLTLLDSIVGHIYFGAFVIKKELIVYLTFSLVWVPYFVVSKRVRNTFVNT